MKKIILALTTLGVAAMFTACGDDSSSGGSGNLVSCDVKVSMSMLGFSMESHTCGEAPNTSANAAKIKEKCNTQSVSEEGVSSSVKIGTGCPGGAVLTCPDEDGTAYFYGDDMKGVTCDEVME